MTTLNHLVWYDYVFILIAILLAVALFTYLYAMFMSIRYVGMFRSLDLKYLEIRKEMLISRFHSLEDKEVIEKDLKEIRDMEKELDLDNHNFDDYIKKWEDTKNEVNKRGYI
jgi:hypothetical protein